MPRLPRFSSPHQVYKSSHPQNPNHIFLNNLPYQLQQLQLALLIYPVFVFLKELKMSRPGDWNCRSCQHLNFQRRDSCQRCGEPRHGSERGGGGDFGFGGRGSSSSFGFTGPDVRPGDWYCNIGNCGAHNFASRSSCFKCGAFKDESGGGGGFDGGDMSRGRNFGFGGGSGGGRSGWKSGDWICGRAGCNEHNFASRMECFRCNAPREPGSRSTY